MIASCENADRPIQFLMKKLSALLVSAILISGLGCATVSLPPNSRVVGGGLQITWTAPEDGTAVLVESSSGKVVATETVGAGDEFEFKANRETEAEVLSRLFGSPLPYDARFVLYFSPKR